MGCQTNAELIYGCALKYRFPSRDTRRNDPKDPDKDMDTIVKKFNAKHEHIRLVSCARDLEYDQEERACFLAIKLPPAAEQAIDDAYDSDCLNYRDEDDSLPVKRLLDSLHVATVTMEDLLSRAAEWKKHERELRDAAQEFGEEPDNIKIGVHAVAWVG